MCTKKEVRNIIFGIVALNKFDDPNFPIAMGNIYTNNTQHVSETTWKWDDVRPSSLGFIILAQDNQQLWDVLPYIFLPLGRSWKDWRKHLMAVDVLFCLLLTVLSCNSKIFVALVLMVV